MRTMLIPTILLLFCSLTQLANARAPVDGCGIIYNCYVPWNCNTASQPFQDNLLELRRGDTIEDTCRALIRFHSYAKHWVHVSIESYDADTKYVAFFQKDKNKAITREFSCIEKTSTPREYEAKYGTKAQHIISDYEANDKAKLRCSFVVNVPSDKSVIATEDGTLSYFEVRKDPAKPETSDVSLETALLTIAQTLLKCDPTTLDFNKEITDKEKKYSKVKVEPGKYYCKNSEIYKLEFKKEDEPGIERKNSYEEVTNLKCDYSTKNFVLERKGQNPEPILYRATMDIRCAAEARFFCDYELKTTANEKKLDRYYDPARKNPSTIKCPETHPYLFIDGRLIMNPQFECINYGGTEYWRVNKNHRLTPKGPVTHCSDKIKCNVKYKIPDSSVLKGTLNGFRPVCHKEDGVLQVGKDVVFEVTCDETVGDIKFELVNSRGVLHVVDATTIFECVYAEKEDVEQNKLNNNKLIVAASVSITICIALVVGCVVGTLIISRRHIAKMNIKQRAEACEKFKRDELVFKHYGFGSKEKRAIRDAAKPKEEKKEKVVVDGEEEEEEKEEVVEALPKSAPCADPSLWNDQIMDFCCTTEKALSMPVHIHEVASAPAAKADAAVISAAQDIFKKEIATKIIDHPKPRTLERLPSQWTEFENISREKCPKPKNPMDDLDI